MTTDISTGSLTVAEAAKRLGVSSQTIWRWIDRGILPAFRVGPKRVRISAADLDGVRRPRPQRSQDPEAAPPPAKMTPEQREAALRWIEEARKEQARLLASRGGKLFSPSWELINEGRDERTAELP